MKEQNKISLFESRNLNRNLEVSFSFIKQNYGAICKAISFFIPIVLLSAYLMPDMIEIQSRSSGSMNVIDILRNYGTDFWLAYLFIGLAGYLTSVYTVCYMAEYAQSDLPVQSSAVWEKFKKAFVPLFICQLLYTLIVFLASIFCILPGVFLGVSMIFYSFVYVVEGETMTGALKRSYNLVKGNWWNVFGYVLLFGILVYIVSAMFSIPLGLATLGHMLEIDFFTNSIYHLVAGVIAYVGDLFVAPVMYIALGIIYFSLRNSDEGIDLETRIDEIGGKEEHPNYTKTY